MLLVLLLMSGPYVLSQNSASDRETDTIRQLQVVEITAAPIRQRTTGQRTDSWDSTQLRPLAANNLGELLSMQSGLFIKSYGLGSSATSSLRGGSAGHTQVIWNGLPVQNPMLGQLDFSLIPVGLVDEVSIAYGGNTATWGSGAIAGTVFLENKPDIQPGFSISTRSETGSFGWWDQQVKIQYAQGGLRQALRYFHQQATNDFSYTVSPSLPERKQTNAALRQDGLLHELYWDISPRQRLTSHVWLQQNDRELPPRTIQNRSLAEQSDRFIRTAINWQRTGSRGVLSVRGGLFREEQGYSNPLAGLDTENNFWKAIGEVDQTWRISPNQQLQTGINHTWQQSAAGAYGQSRQQNRSSAFVLFRQTWGNWEGQLNARQELVDGTPAPIVPAVGLSRQLTNSLSLHARVSRNYRLPTLNDLYWQPGGNPNLQPEQGWSEELGIKARFPLGGRADQSADWSNRHRSDRDANATKGRLTYSLTIFNRNITDWIQWAIAEGQPFFSPYNITAVWSRGIEQRAAANFVFRKVKIEISGGYDFIRSTYQKSVETPAFNKGDQLAYTPRHQWFGRLGGKYKWLSLAYQHHYTGRVGTLNFSELPGYHRGQLVANADWSWQSFAGQLFFRVENVWDVDYEVIEFQAMPGRYFRMGMEIKFHRKNRLISRQ